MLVGGLSELLIDGQTNLFLKEISEAEIAEKIVFMLESNAKEKMRLCAKKYAKSYSWEAVVDKLLWVYQEVMET